MLSGEQKIVERCLHGDDAAWEIIVNTYARRLFTLSYRYTNSRDDSEDLTQEILIRVYRNLYSYRAEAGSFQGWVLQIARNLIIDFYRKNRRYQPAGGSEELETMSIPDRNSPDPHVSAERMEASQFLQEGLQSLPPELKEAIILRELEGLAYQEIADLLQVPQGTVKSRINRGRLELAKLLIKRRTKRRLDI